MNTTPEPELSVLRPVPMMSPSPHRKRWDKDRIVTDLATEDSEGDDDVVQDHDVTSPKPILVPRPVPPQEIIDEVNLNFKCLKI